MVKKHLPTLQELFSLLKKCVQDHKVIPFHRIEELKDTSHKISWICIESHYDLNDDEYCLYSDAQTILDEFEKLNDPHKDCDIYECEEYQNCHDSDDSDYE